MQNPGVLGFHNQHQPEHHTHCAVKQAGVHVPSNRDTSSTSVDSLELNTPSSPHLTRQSRGTPAGAGQLPAPRDLTALKTDLTADLTA
jgi:hypothetical protein